MNIADSIVLTGLRATAKGAGDFLQDLAEDLAKDVDTNHPCPSRASAVAHALAAAKHMREGQVEMRKLTNILEQMDEERATT